MLVTRQVLLQVLRTTKKHCTYSWSLMSCIRAFCHVASEESSLERGVSFDHQDVQGCSTHSVSILVVTGNVAHHDRAKCSFGFLQKREDDAFKDERS